MPTLRLELDARPPAQAIERLRTDLDPYGTLQEVANAHLGACETAFFLSLFSDVVQGIDVLVSWLGALHDVAPRAHKATIRLADGGCFTVETSDADALRAALKAALKIL